MKSNSPLNNEMFNVLCMICEIYPLKKKPRKLKKNVFQKHVSRNV